MGKAIFFPSCSWLTHSSLNYFSFGSSLATVRNRAVAKLLFFILQRVSYSSVSFGFILNSLQNAGLSDTLRALYKPSLIAVPCTDVFPPQAPKKGKRRIILIAQLGLEEAILLVVTLIWL